MTASAKPVEARPGVVAELGTVLREIWESRDLLYQLTRRDITIRYKQAIMGFAWAVLMPLLIVLSGFMIRLAMSKFAGRPLVVTTLAAIAVKAIPWAFFVGAIGFATPSLSGNLNLVTKIYFPREVLTAEHRARADQGHRRRRWSRWPSCSRSSASTTPGSCSGCRSCSRCSGLRGAPPALFLSRANLFFRDVKYIVQVFLTFGIFFTPVILDAPMSGPRAAPIVMLNPLAPLLEGLNLAVVGHTTSCATPATSASGEIRRSGIPGSSGLFGDLGGRWPARQPVLFRRSDLFAEYV